MDDPTTTNSNATPQFATAEYASPGGSETCKSCNRPVSGSYYRVNGSLACSNCVSQLQSQLPRDSHSAFVRGMIFGVGGAILGLILYSTFGIITGLEIGYLSLAVGYIVGKAIRMGSGGVGGRRYQIAALALTYFAVSMSAVPIGIYESIKDAKAKPHPVSSSTPTTGNPSKVDSGVDSPTSPEAKAVAKDEKPGMGIGKLLGTLLLFGLASPFMELQNPINGALGIVILLVGIRIAWRLTSAPQIDIIGPFQTKPVSA
jgi:hypothetical protein